MAADEPPTKAERMYARTLLTIPTGKVPRRCRRTRRVAGVLVAAGAVGVIELAWEGEWAVLVAFLFGVLGGAVAWVWALTHYAEVRHQVLLRVCDWERVERLAEEDPAEPLYGHIRMNKDSDSGRVSGGDGAS